MSTAHVLGNSWKPQPRELFRNKVTWWINNTVLLLSERFCFTSRSLDKESEACLCVFLSRQSIPDYSGVMSLHCTLSKDKLHGETAREMGFACGNGLQAPHTSHCNPTSVQRDHFNSLPAHLVHFHQIIIWDIVYMWPLSYQHCMSDFNCDYCSEWWTFDRSDNDCNSKLFWVNESWV